MAISTYRAVAPIFHLESLANAPDDSKSEKNYFLFLIGLARARLHFTNLGAHEIIGKFAHRCRRKLLEILDLSRCVLCSYIIGFLITMYPDLLVIILLLPPSMRVFFLQSPFLLLIPSTSQAMVARSLLPLIVS